ncbi:MAG: RNA polymerase sigma factor [Actinomycetota bacterium]|nr:RNA polymerase sigma factor [Actinomycetota bacterium]
MALSLDEVFRAEWSRVLANLIRFTGDLDLAEECAQEAFVRAAEVGITGTTNPGAWLTTVGKRIAIDRMRREATLARKLPFLVADSDVADEVEASPIDDDRLRLAFVACHPNLGEEARVALALRLVCGVATVDIAAVFMVPEATMAARITRAKKRIGSTDARFELPLLAELADRIDAVRTTIYLLYTTLHAVPQPAETSAGPSVAAAISMAAQLVSLYPEDSESAGLYALLLLTEARRPGRVSSHGDALALDEVDRTLWDGELITEGLAQAARALPGGGRFALQAGISGLHSAIPTWDATPWHDIVRLYERLIGIWPSPSARLGALIARNYLTGPETALVELDKLVGDLGGVPDRQVAATRGDLLRRLGRHREAIVAYEAAARLEPDPVLHGYLVRRAEESAHRDS